MRNIALRVEYDGTDFVGSQWQTNGRTVQGELEGAWAQFTQERRRINLAGRTDAGVHARGQVASVLTETTHDTETIVRGMNAVLPSDIAVHAAWDTPREFHARHSAIRREYRYLIDNGAVGSAILRGQVLHVSRELDCDAMDRAIASLIGTHDFVAFSAGLSEGSTVRTCYRATCARAELWGQSLLVIDIAANAFLRHMVRVIVGALLMVGGGRLSHTDFAAPLIDGQRRRAIQMAPAHGLYLMTVRYPEDGSARRLAGALQG